MTILEKIYIQKQDPSRVFLFKEGAFYKVYNEGAFLLRDKNFKVSVKKMKSIEGEVLSVGFPGQVFEKLKIEFGVNEDKNYYTCHYNKVFEEIEFTNWRDELLKMQPETELINNTDLLEKIKKYPLGNKTPIEVFMWVAELQKQIH